MGPVSREKIQELIKKGTIKGDDEVCAGNGYWVRVREEDLIEKYITQAKVQSFNPVQEAQVCVVGEAENSSDEVDDITQAQVNLNDMMDASYESSQELEQEDVTDEIQDDEEEEEDEDEEEQAIPVRNSLSARLASANVLYFIAFLFLLLVIISFKYKKTILNKINGSVSLIGVPYVYAQSSNTIEKKKSGFNYQN